VDRGESIEKRMTKERITRAVSRIGTRANITSTSNKIETKETTWSWLREEGNTRRSPGNQQPEEEQNEDQEERHEHKTTAISRRVTRSKKVITASRINNKTTTRAQRAPKRNFST
jgi:hypothetical protein